MSSSSSYYRKKKQAKINQLLRESPYLHPTAGRLAQKWPTEICGRHERFVYPQTTTNVTSTNNENTSDVFLEPGYITPAVIDTPDTHDDVMHLHLTISQAEELAGPSTSSPVTLRDQESLVITQATACEDFNAQRAEFTEASVSNFVNRLDIPTGLSELWSIFRRHRAPNNMMGDVLHWFRDKQLQLVSAVSTQGLPESLRLPLDYRGAQKQLQLNSVFTVNVYCLCLICQKWKARSMFATPFQKPCCSLLPNDTESHFIVYQIHEILQLLLPHYHPRVQQGYYNGCTRLEKIRNAVQGTDNDVYISIGFDGVPFSQSSGISVYPVLATFDGLSGKHTKASTFIIAMWMGSSTTSKPDVRAVFGPIISQLKILAATPMEWLDTDGNTRLSRVFMTTIMTDTVGRAQVMLLAQFNGFYGCGWCKQINSKKDKHWDYKQPEHQAAARTDTELRNQLNLLFDEMGNPLSAESENGPDGIQGRTPFIDLTYVDIVQDFPPCTMHANYEGTAKSLKTMWMKRKDLTAADVSAIDAFLVSCKPPNRITRPPRQLEKMKKAHEYCVWLFYAAPVVLQDHLSTDLYNHFLHLVRGLSFLHKDCPSSAEIATADQELTAFLTEYSTHYGTENKKYNIHILQHLCDFVRARGPLYRFSLMPMESYNRHIKELPTGPKYVTMQMCTRYLEETVFKARDVLKTVDTPHLEFEPEGQHSVCECPIDLLREYLSGAFGVESVYFTRLKFDQRIYHSLSYAAVTTTNSTCYKVGDGVFFDAHMFVKTAAAGYKAIGKALHGEKYQGMFYSFSCSQSPTFSAVCAAALQNVVFKMQYKDKIYIAEFLNDFESYAE